MTQKFRANDVVVFPQIFSNLPDKVGIVLSVVEVPDYVGTFTILRVRVAEGGEMNVNAVDSRLAQSDDIRSEMERHISAIRELDSFLKRTESQSDNN